MILLMMNQMMMSLPMNFSIYNRPILVSSYHRLSTVTVDKMRLKPKNGKNFFFSSHENNQTEGNRIENPKLAVQSVYR